MNQRRRAVLRRLSQLAALLLVPGRAPARDAPRLVRLAAAAAFSAAFVRDRLTPGTPLRVTHSRSALIVSLGSHPLGLLPHALAARLGAPPDRWEATLAAARTDARGRSEIDVRLAPRRTGT